MHPHRILSLLFLLLLSLALGACASHEARPAPEPGAPLPAVTLERGDRVFVTIENGKSMTEDLHSMLTAYLQSERGLNPAPDAGDADLVILVEIRDVWATSDGSRVSAGRTLGNVGTGTMLGVLLGGLVDGRGGAIVGAGINDVMYALCGVGLATFTMAWFGKKDYERIFSTVMMFGYLVASLGVPIMMKIYEVTGAFENVFVFGFIVCAIIIVCLLVGEKQSAKLPQETVEVAAEAAPQE